METTDPSPQRFRRTTLACGCALSVLGLTALAGWITHHPILLGFRSNYIPMAPNTAVAFLSLGVALIAREMSLPAIAWGAAILVGLVSGTRTLEYATGWQIGVDRVFLRVPTASFGLAPLGKMALATAVGFLAASASTLLNLWGSRRPTPRDLGGGAALLVGAIGLIFSLGYLFSPNAPLLYGTQSIPMALNTAIGFVILGVGLIAAAGPSSFPMLRLCGGSTRARLLRVFLPLVMVTVGLVAWLTHVVSLTAGASSAAISSAALTTVAILVFSIICERVSRRIGQALENAEAELQAANENLERKVEERTGELRRAFGELQRSHEALQAAHRELKDAQARMLQQAKMASLGQTAAGVAHEINNPLAFVTNNLVVLKRELAGIHDIVRLYQKAEHTLEEYQRDLLEQIHVLSEDLDLPYVLGNLPGLMDRSRDGLRRIQKIVSDLRDFAHLDDSDEKATDLNAGIENTVSLMRSVANSRGVSLETDLSPLPPVVCFGAKINLAVQNLVSNAIDACSSGGHVTVSSRPAGDGVTIEVRDDGTGIDPAIRDRIFDPFFTTKPIGHGTGLGLAMSFGVVRDHGGTIDVDSTPGAGSRFLIRLPLGSSRGRSRPPSGPLAQAAR